VDAYKGVFVRSDLTGEQHYLVNVLNSRRKANTRLTMKRKIEKLLFKIATEDAKALYSEQGAEGLWVSKDQLFSEIKKDEYWNLVSEERFDEIQDGQSPTEAEILGVRDHRLEEWLSGDADADVVPAYSLVEVTDGGDNRGIAVILCTGYSFSELSIWVEGVFDTKVAAIAYLNENGWTRLG
jgi:hypothetical protein